MTALRREKSYRIADLPVFKRKLLEWAQQYDEVVWLNSNGHQEKYGTFDSILAVDALTALVTDTENGFEKLKEYQKEMKDWLFGYLSYDLKNDVEDLFSDNNDELHFPELQFFQPKKIISISGDSVNFNYLSMVDDEMESDFSAILKTSEESGPNSDEITPMRIRMRIFKDEYFRQVKKLLGHIHRGDIYEANFCQEFYIDNSRINPLEAYRRLNTISKAPFAVFQKFRNNFLLCASPERYLRKIENKVISQPIKGTARRSPYSAEDLSLKTVLENDKKERAENVMIVDLVRNDLSKSALKGSVEVEELCKVYSFEQVHQMISTITAQVPKDKNPVDIIKETFPMGSMTGAPKVSAMKIIEELEAFKRGLYSGTVGYFTPEGDFDFNVVIRSILYNASRRYTSFSVGSAITAKSVPEKEYEECLLKAKAMREVLEGNKEATSGFRI